MKRILFSLLPLLLLFCSCSREEIIRYDPPMMTIITDSGEYTAVRFGYRWERERKEDAVDYVNPVTYEYAPIPVSAGESCQLAFSGRDTSPEMYIIRFYPAGGGERQIVDYSLNRHADDPEYEWSASLLITITESGVFTVEAVWPEWVANSIVTDATYGFRVIVE
ncbi:MAG: hypothetical protein II680_12835 [Clostridia bacterium]|nr:hypothetical protein [Clostridia bacterium]